MRQLTIGLLGAVLLCAGAAHADTEDEARAAFKQGVKHYEAGRIEAALEAFRKADELQPSWKIQFNIGQCEAALKHYGRAIEAFEAYMAGAGDEISVQRRDKVIAELDRLRKLTGMLSVEGPDGVTVIVDGFERGTTPLSGRLRVVAGVDHQLVGKRGDTVVARKTVKVGGGETLAVDIGEGEAGPPTGVSGAGKTEQGEEGEPPLLEADDDDGGLPILFWVGAGLTVAAAGTGVGFGVASNSRADDFDAKNKQVAAGNLPADDKGMLDAKDDVETYETMTNAMLITAGVLAAATAVVLIVHLTGGDDEDPDDAEVSVAPNGLLVSF
jgi:hypothetical protein